MGGLESNVSTGSRTLFVASFCSRVDVPKKVAMSSTRVGLVVAFFAVVVVMVVMVISGSVSATMVERNLSTSTTLLYSREIIPIMMLRRLSRTWRVIFVAAAFVIPGVIIRVVLSWVWFAMRALHQEERLFTISIFLFYIEAEKNASFIKSIMPRCLNAVGQGDNGGQGPL